MKKLNLKQKLAAALCTAMLLTQALPAAYAQGGDGTDPLSGPAPGEGGVVTTQTTPPAAEETTPPPAAEETTPPPAAEETTPPTAEETTPPPAPVLFESENSGEGDGSGTFGLAKNTAPVEAKISISYRTTDESRAGESDGTITGTVTDTTGTLPIALAIYKDGAECGAAAIYSEGESFTFSHLAAGEYLINYVYSGSSVVNIQDKVEVKAAAPAAPAEPKIDRITHQDQNATAADAKDGVVSAVVEFSNASELLVAIYVRGESTAIDAAKLSSGSAYTFAGLAPGEYQVNYALDGELCESEYISIGADAAPAPKPSISVNYAYTDASSASAQDGVIKGAVTVTNGTYPLHVELFEKTGTSALRGTTLTADGTGFTFDRLPAGEYLINYAFEGSQSVDKQDLVKVEYAARAAIAITSVTPGEKTLTVKGTTQAGAQVLVQAEPAGAKAEVLVVGSDGKFETSLSASPAVYSKVSAFYVTDANSMVSAGGSWTVTAPVTAPAIAVDPITNHSTTVVVKTGANLAVTLTTPDSTQTLMSDANGLVHFSLTHKYLNGEEFTITVVYGSGSGQTVSQKATVGGAADYNDLEYGDYGDAVLRLTTRLNQLGYPVAPTKDYNSTVREAVRLFQIANGQEADGEAGDRMQSALYSVSAIHYGSGRYPTLVRGDKGLALIKTLQQRLKDLGYYTIKVDGIFGSGTQRAVRLFQSVNGLTETGIADNATQVLLYSSAAKPLNYGTSGSYSTLQRSGKYKSAVVPLQRRLRELGYYTGSVDGYFGSKTYRAVRNFQSRNGLGVTGVADALTQQLLYSSAAKKYDGSTAGSSSGTSTGYRLLYWGCRGEEVRRLQSALISAGYKSYVRSADGIYGQWTYDAVCAYQRDHGLAVDGIAGKKTQNKLYGTNY